MMINVAFLMFGMVQSDFAPRCISSSSAAATPTTTVLKAEISGMAHHPTNNLLAAFSNHKGQKRGKIVLWK
jgi:hypothetical protein